MKIGILLSGGKDSLYSAYLASKYHELSCAITIKSLNKESYMFHTPNIDLVELQTKSMKIPLIEITTKGEKEKELKELKKAIIEAKEKFDIQGIITGAVASQYQASRVQKICHELDLWCINPLWQIEQNKLLEELIEKKFEIIIAGVYAYPFEKKWLGKIITKETIKELKEYQTKYEINPAGEGGEIETFVTDCPLFHEKINITKTKTEYKNFSGTITFEEAELVEKKHSKEKKETNKEKEINENKKPNEEKERKTNEKLNREEKPNILIINTSTEEAPLYFHEFIRPIKDICEDENQSLTIIKIKELKEKKIEIENFDKIIISGTSLKDNKFLEEKNEIQKLIKIKKSIMGICAGAELLIPETIELKPILEIGPKKLSEIKKDKLTKDLDEKEGYFLHQFGIENKNYEEIDILLTTEKGVAAFKYPNKPIYGFQFHPEVSQKQIIRKFLKN